MSHWANTPAERAYMYGQIDNARDARDDARRDVAPDPGPFWEINAALAADERARRRLLDEPLPPEWQVPDLSHLAPPASK